MCGISKQKDSFVFHTSRDSAFSNAQLEVRMRKTGTAMRSSDHMLSNGSQFSGVLIISRFAEVSRSFSLERSLIHPFLNPFQSEIVLVFISIVFRFCTGDCLSHIETLSRKIWFAIVLKKTCRLLALFFSRCTLSVEGVCALCGSLSNTQITFCCT